MYNTILFDFDGTLIDSNEIIINALNATSMKFVGENLTNDELNSILGKPLESQMKSIREENWKELDEFYRVYYREHRDSITKIFDGVEDMLHELAELGCKLGIVSNKGTSGILHGLEKFGIKSYFDIVISADDVLQSKPNPECVFKALEALNKDLKNTILVGDSIHDIECGKNAGVKTVLVGWTILDKDKIMKLEPNFVINTPLELIELIK